MDVFFTPINKIICLSGVLALGSLFVILACALYQNYYPLIDVLVFVLAPLPYAIFGKSRLSGQVFMNDRAQSAQDIGLFMTGTLVASGLIIPLVFYHATLITETSCIMTIVGGFIIYASIVVFTWFFGGNWEEDEDALFSY
ncbi:HFL189Wp [Eremothecium sinecaudum]|uniref:HFL189Wp n=1 Tax=Eremothecium sinecaudum TaxID=45286 RepID=A0A0X8HUB1_9SACH|nr:HFL189Wp [Eremothecium sinecaudum]AMD21667.1 HFL189Wp [Eremothecium sinecaudum]